MTSLDFPRPRLIRIAYRMDRSRSPSALPIALRKSRTRSFHVPAALRTPRRRSAQNNSPANDVGSRPVCTLGAMHSAAAKLQIDRLRTWRLGKSKDVSIAAAAQRVAADARRADRGLAKVGEMWRELVPVEFADCCQPASVRMGTLEVACDSSAAAYALNRWFQSEGAAALARRGVAVIRLRTVLVAARTGVQPKDVESGKKGRARRDR